MKRFRKPAILTAAAVLLISPFTPQTAAASAEVKDLVLLENAAQVHEEIENNEVDLTALNLYEDGHYTKVEENLNWSSSNKNVATVDKDGTVTLTGQNGRTFISVSDGKNKDRIAVDHKPAQGEPALVKQKGDQYDLIHNAIEGMTLEEKVGQMLMPDFRNWEGKNVTKMLPEIEQVVKDYHLGGVILFRENVVTTEQTAELVADYQEASQEQGLLMAIDQEGGIVTRLQSGTDMPGNMALGATRSPEITEDVGTAIGSELESLGINMNLAPVLDVNNNPDNPVIGTRSFGEDPELVADLGIAYTKGLQSTGVAATAKHFPGHGDTAVDSHLGLPEVPYDKERLMEVELYPFQKAMEADIDAIMTAHVTFPKIDDTKVISQKDGTEISLPATLSPKVLTGLMREEMGYDGLIITDALNMKAISDHFGSVDAVIRAVKAGTDIVLMPVGLEEVAEGLLDAVKSGEISEERIEQSVERILTLKLERGIFKEETQPNMDEILSEANATVGSPEHQAIEKEASDRSITLVKNDDVLPLNLDGKIVVVGNTFIDRLHTSISAYRDDVQLIKSTQPLNDDQLAQVQEADHIIVGTYTYNVAGRAPSSSQMQLVQQLINEADAPVIGVGIRNPYDVMAYPQVDSYLAQYGFNDVSFDATAATIFGENNPTGQLPVTIPGEDGKALYEFGHGLSY
ncbi:glycoside hydrolase family 3 protein [Halobacillus sp. Marseille-Q1614]|uniref:glycoside hydrolase family 3 protein n=1 Tax=Halobacillus sp. Marseille-Q1614 TaxID=2709134 RepID=UPI00157149FE|nr:glycoside hydrolase family 3 protein [Halobacillus sp. Marseille-Q1614]